MADLSDVENALVTLIGAAVYPNGTNSPSVVASPVRIYRGWPTPANLDADLKAGIANVSVYSQPNSERCTTRYAQEWQTSVDPVHTLSAVVLGQTITIGGTISVPQNVSVLIGNNAVSYGVLLSDTLASVATALAALISAYVPASVVGPVITVTTGKAIQARVGAQGTLWQELGRQQKGFQISLWCATPTQRDALAKSIGPALRSTNFMTLADNSAARLQYRSTISSDEAEKRTVYRREFIYMVEYAESITQIATEVTINQIAISAGGNPFITLNQ